MNTYGLDLMGRRRRRRHSAEFKAMVVGECRGLGVDGGSRASRIDELLPHHWRPVVLAH